MLRSFLSAYRTLPSFLPSPGPPCNYCGGAPCCSCSVQYMNTGASSSQFVQLLNSILSNRPTETLADPSLTELTNELLCQQLRFAQE